MKLGRWLLLGAAIAVADCAPTIGPVTPDVQVLVVLDSLEDVLRIIPVDSTGIVHTIQIPHLSGTTALASHGAIAAIGGGDSVFVLNLGTGHIVCPPTPLGEGANLTSIAFADSGDAFAASPVGGRVTRFFSATSPQQCGGAYIPLNGGPQGFGVARGRLFVTIANTIDANAHPPCDPIPGAICVSWLRTSASLGGDSIPLSGPGNAKAGVFASDNSLYVIEAGHNHGDGTLSQVDPLQTSGTGGPSYPGFGTNPSYITTDGGDRVFVASPVDGLMVFNVRIHQVERDANHPIALNGSVRGLASDDVGRIYALLAGSCAAGGTGTVNVLGTDLSSQSYIPVGRCPVAISVTNIPATLYHFDN